MPSSNMFFSKTNRGQYIRSIQVSEFWQMVKSMQELLSVSNNDFRQLMTKKIHQFGNIEFTFSTSAYKNTFAEANNVLYSWHRFLENVKQDYGTKKQTGIKCRYASFCLQLNWLGWLWKSLIWFCCWFWVGKLWFVSFRVSGDVLYLYG